MNQEGREEVLFHQPQPQPLDDCCPSALRSPASQELEAVLQTNSTNDDCIKLQSPFGDGGSCLLDGNEVSTCDEDETVCDVCFHSYVIRQKKIWTHSYIHLSHKITAHPYCSHQYTQSWEMIHIRFSSRITSPQYCSHQYTQSWEMFQKPISILVNAIIGNVHLRKKFQAMKLTYQLDISCLILKIKLQIIGF